MSLLSQAADCLAATLASVAAESGVYEPLDKPAFQLSGTMVLNEHEVFNGNMGLPTKVIFHDWIFAKADLVAEVDDESVAVTPSKGDRWTTTINGVEETYEVLPIDKRQCFEPHDASGVMLLVHTKKVAA